tara:strand:- start:951 stop:1178 length:228 start_codon:yes stop_codon:yes gene_type:complete
MNNDTRERNFELVKKKLKSLSRKSMKILDSTLMGYGDYSHAQILSAEAVLKLNTLFSFEKDPDHISEAMVEDTLL